MRNRENKDDDEYYLRYTYMQLWRPRCRHDFKIIDSSLFHFFVIKLCEVYSPSSSDFDSGLLGSNWCYYKLPVNALAVDSFES